MEIKDIIGLIEEQIKEQDAIYHRTAVKFGLSDSAMCVLYILADNERTYTQQDICRISRFAKQTVNSAISSLVKNNYITLEPIPELVIENCASGGHRLEPSTMELCSQASFSDAHECKSIPIIAANVQRMIKPSQSQIWAVLRKDDDIHRVNYSLTAGFLGRLCLSGEIFDVTEENWQITLEAIKLYGEITPIIKDGYTRIIECTAEDYNDPTGYQIVLRELGDKALMIVHTFKDGANPPVEKHHEGWKIIKTFGSDLDGDFRGKAYLIER